MLKANFAHSGDVGVPVLDEMISFDPELIHSFSPGLKHNASISTYVELLLCSRLTGKMLKTRVFLLIVKSGNLSFSKLKESQPFTLTKCLN